MDPAGFWRLIALVDQRALAREQAQDAVEPVTALLVQLGAHAAIAFAEHLRDALRALDGPAWAAATGERPGSRGFLYARCYIVARGESHYHAVRSRPAAGDSGEDYWCEALLYVARSAWSTITGKDPEAFPIAVS